MKKIIRISCVLALIVSVLVGCVNFDISKAKKASEVFLKSIYTVDAKEIAVFNTIILPEITGEDQESEENHKKQSDEFLKIMKSVDKEIIPLMTKKGYKEASSYQFNISSVEICSKNNYTTQITGMYSSANMYKDFIDTDNVNYIYAVKYNFISSDGKTIQADVGKGVIELTKEDGKWKVCSFDILQFPKLNN
ncbi:MAG: hypothetical protein N2B06_02310 [Clostridium sp.]